MATLMQKNTHYIDNKKFLASLIEYRSSCAEAQKKGEEDPIIPNYIGECFIKIANHLCFKTNFINYSFRDDMVSDGIENCLVAVKKFDPTKSENPFAYFTQIVYFAFIRRIQKEKKQQSIKYKMLENVDLDEIITQEQDSGDYNDQFLDYVRKQIDYFEMSNKKHELTSAKKSAKLADEITNSLNFDELYNDTKD
jgi:DNA-directed RNA polymerase specialized sigma subunit